MSRLVNYKIKPLIQSYISAPLGIAFYLGDMKTLITTGVYIWAIMGGDKKIVVDAGMQESDDGLVHGFPARGGGKKGTLEALSSVGWNPEDVDVLILSHLHFDHVATVELFEKAEIYVQTKEWEFAHNPTLHMVGTYDKEILNRIENMNLILVDGIQEILPGIKLVPLPGHTKGLQGILVSTKNGEYLLSSDHFYTYANIKPPKEPEEVVDLDGKKLTIQPSLLPFMPIGLHVDLSEWFDSSFKIEKLVDKDKIIPGHDPTIIDKIFPD